MVEDTIDFFSTHLFGVAAVFYIFLVLRFLAITSSVHFILWTWQPEFLKSRRIQNGTLRPGQIRQEVKNALLGFLTWSLIAQFCFFLFQNDFTHVYLNWDQYPVWIVPVNILGWMLFHDVYFYWTHRWLHTPWAYRNIHYVHHRSKIPNPYSSHSFHWIEALINGFYIIPILLFMPIHPVMLFFMGVVTHFFTIWGHFNYELMPFQTWFKWWGRWVTTSTHHNFHHVEVNKNFGLYLRYWDLWFSTLSAETEKFFMSRVGLSEKIKTGSESESGLEISRDS
jgi:lathosterol oxidase